MFLTLWFILIWYKFFQKRVNIMEMFCFGYQPLNFISVPRLKLTFGDWQVEKFRGSNLLPGKTLKVIIPRPCPVRFFFHLLKKYQTHFLLLTRWIVGFLINAGAIWLLYFISVTRSVACFSSLTHYFLEINNDNFPRISFFG